jgi:hypothetical protein
VLRRSALIHVVDAGDDDDDGRLLRDDVLFEARADLIPWLMTFQPGCVFISQCAYWLVSSPRPFGGDSRGDSNAGVPAVVESPIATIVTRGAD